MSRLRVFSIVLLIIPVFCSQISAQIDTTKKLLVYKYSILEEIAPSATRKTSKALDEALALKADLVLLHLNTYGGLVSDADSIRTRILNSPIPVYVFIENNAASAGALISIACDKIFMRKGANIGAATVVDQSGAAAPDKYQSYMRSKMRATAEARGRNPDIAEGMVDGNIVVKGVNEKGQVITLTTSEAIKHGFCDGQAESIDEALHLMGIKDYEVIEQKVTFIDKAMGWLLNPAVSGVLILLILGGIYYEIRSPGIGFALLVSVVAALLYFAPLYLEGLASNWEILIFIAGLVLLGVEIFVIPGFGVAGISGLVLIFGSFVLAAINNIDFDFSLTGSGALNAALLKVLLALIGFVAVAFLLGGSFGNSRLFKNIALEASLESKAPAIPHIEKPSWVGSSGITRSDLRPVGKVLINDHNFEARAMAGYIASGTRVRVVEDKGSELIVIEEE